MTHEEAVRKAAACMRLAQSSNPNEAALAAAKAHDIMLRFNISTEQLKGEADRPEPDEPIQSFDREPALRATKKDNIWARALAHCVAKAYGCGSYFRRVNAGGSVEIFLVGRPSDVQTARYMADLFAEEVRKLARTHTKGYSLNYECSFKLGVVDAIRAKLHEQKAATERAVRAEAVNPGALVRVNAAIAKVDQRRAAVEKWTEDNLKLRKVRNVSSGTNLTAREHGREEGRKVEVSSRAKGGLTSGAKQLSRA